MSSKASSCCCDGPSTIIFACSGSSNVGQISHLVALKAVKEGLGQMSCLAGVGAHLSGFVVSARDCDQLVVIDGCEQKCALQVFEHVEIQPNVYLELTENGFEKRHGIDVTKEDTDKALLLLRDRLRGLSC